MRNLETESIRQKIEDLCRCEAMRPQSPMVMILGEGEFEIVPLEPSPQFQEHLQYLNRLMARSSGIPRRFLENMPDHSCIECGDEIPPGRSGRKCKVCRRELISSGATGIEPVRTSIPPAGCPEIETHR